MLSSRPFSHSSVVRSSTPALRKNAIFLHGWIVMKLATKVHQVIENCWKAFQGQRSKVKVTKSDKASCIIIIIVIVFLCATGLSCVRFDKISWTYRKCAGVQYQHGRIRESNRSVISSKRERGPSPFSRPTVRYRTFTLYSRAGDEQKQRYEWKLRRCS